MLRDFFIENLITDYVIIKCVIAIRGYLGIANDDRSYKRRRKLNAINTSNNSSNALRNRIGSY